MNHTVPAHAFALDGAPRIPATEPMTWTFTNADTGKPVTVTCMRGCTTDHTADMATPTSPDDISCYTDGPEITLPVVGTEDTSRNGGRDFTVLGFRMSVMPLSSTIAERLPHLNIEVFEDLWLEGLDPDALATVIRQLGDQVARLRVAHAQLCDVRDEYRRRSA